MTFLGTLYPFQIEAQEVMVDRGQVLLAMVMGAGKTPTTLSVLEHLFSISEIQKVIIIVPSSLKYQWLREIKKFTNSRAIVIDGTPKEREALWRLAINSKYVIINAELLLNDELFFKKAGFDTMVVDEATIIKSFNAKRSKLIKKLGKTCHYRFALTGQPIENRPEELYSIMQFVDPTILGRFDVFDRTFIVRDSYGRPIRYRNLNQLNETISDVMVRRTREDIADQLPKVITQLIPIAFDQASAKSYKIIAKDLENELNSAISKNGRSFNLWAHYNSGTSNDAQGEIMSRLTILRMLCDNPQLVFDSANLYLDPSNSDGSKYAAHVVSHGWLPTTAATPKLDAVLKYIEDVLNEDANNKIVLFSFFRNNLKIIQQKTSTLTNSVLFMGGMSSAERDAAKQKFLEDPTTRLFLSSDAGGYGVDLPQANYLISYDLPWSAGKLDQREARIIRLSSTHPHVTVTSFVMKGSVEERQYEMLQQKRGINDAWIDKGYDTQGKFELNLGSLSDFISTSEV